MGSIGSPGHSLRMGSIGSPGAVWLTPKTKKIFRYQGPLSTTKKQRSRTEGCSFSSTRKLSGAASPCLNRRLSGAGSPGRFIPRRFSMDMEAANFCLQSPCVGSTDWSNEVFEEGLTWGSSSVRQQRHRMACLSQGATEKKILNFRLDNVPELKKRRRSEKSVTEVSQTFLKPPRKVPKHPVHILDLPKLPDDFYTHAMCWSVDNHLVAGLSNKLYTCSLGEEGTTLLQELHENIKYVSVSCNAKGNLLAATTNNGEIQIWNLKTLKLSTTIYHSHNLDTNYHSAPVCKLVGLDWSPKDDVLAIGCANGVVEVVDLGWTPSNLVMTKWEPGCCITGLKFSPNGAYLAASTSWHKIVVWDISNIQKPTTIFSQEAHTSAIRALSWYPFKNSILASGGGIDDGYIRIWNVHTGQKLHEISVRAQVCGVLWSPLTKELLTSQSIYNKHSVVIWDYPDLNKVGSLGGHTERVLHMALSPDQSQLATASADETLRIWNLNLCDAASSTRPTQSLLLHGLR